VANLLLFLRGSGGAVTFQTLAVEVSGRRIATVRLDRAARGNAFDQRMLDELAETFAALGADAGVRVVVLRGSGRHFCTGADLARATAASAQEGKHASLRDVLTALDTLPKPTLALVHGAAIGGGAAIAACCDIVVATEEEAFFSIPEVRVGMAPLGVAPFIVRAIGHRAFRRYGLSGERMSAMEARRLGLVHEVCGAAALEDTWTRIADELLHGAPGAISTLKRVIAEYASLATIAQTQATHEPKSPEALEGIASFRERRKPSWYPQ
jgi:methylglutaconyl-CoA hydratase